MDAKNDKHKSWQSSEDQPLPPELQWENMEAGILRKMEALQTAPPATTETRSRRRRVMGRPWLFGALALVVLLYDGHQNAGSMVAAAPSSALLAADPITGEAGGAPTTSQNPTDAGEIAVSGKENQMTLGTKPERQVDAREKPTAAPTTHPASPSLSTPNTPLVSSADEALPRAAAPTPATGRLTRPDPAPAAATAASLPAVAPLPAKAKTDAVASQTAPALDDLPPSTGPTPVTPVVSGTSAPQIWLSGGASWWAAGYGRTRPERAAFERAILSYQGQFSYVRPLKNNLLLLAGLQYQQLESRLNWNTTIDDYEIILEDTVVQIRQNAFTGGQTEVRGDVTLNVPAERRVRHFNTMTLLQLPVGIGKSWSEGRWQTHLLVGAVANLSFTRSGRTIFQDELLDYNGSAPDIWSDQLSFSALLSGGLRYRLTDRLGLITTFQYQYSLTNWSAEAGVSMRPHILNWSVGVGYAL